MRVVPPTSPPQLARNLAPCLTLPQRFATIPRSSSKAVAMREPSPTSFDSCSFTKCSPSARSDGSGSIRRASTSSGEPGGFSRTSSPASASAALVGGADAVPSGSASRDQLVGGTKGLEALLKTRFVVGSETGGDTLGAEGAPSGLLLSMASLAAATLGRGKLPRAAATCVSDALRRSCCVVSSWTSGDKFGSSVGASATCSGSSACCSPGSFCSSKTSSLSTFSSACSTASPSGSGRCTVASTSAAEAPTLSSLSSLVGVSCSFSGRASAVSSSCSASAGSAGSERLGPCSSVPSGAAS
mmetsp:Transcript_64135/g.152953  ORF Transcript_64135/g.152953 Transcript_64135/m.152953 type:complete len:300 (-) Transcript_64135:762-1661(-)